MKRFEPSEEPTDFNKKTRQPGNKWLENHPKAKRPRDYWTQFKPELAAVFGELCAYGIMYEPIGTVDHFLSFRNYPELAYEWNNYRYLSQSLNSSKQMADEKVLDPFEVQDDWFELSLPDLQLHLTDKVPVELREKAQFTLERLQLINGTNIMRQREIWFNLYTSKEISFSGLKRMAPLIANAVEKKKFFSEH